MTKRRLFEWCEHRTDLPAFKNILAGINHEFLHPPGEDDRQDVTVCVHQGEPRTSVRFQTPHDVFDVGVNDDCRLFGRLLHKRDQALELDNVRYWRARPKTPLERERDKLAETRGFFDLTERDGEIVLREVVALIREAADRSRRWLFQGDVCLFALPKNPALVTLLVRDGNRTVEIRLVAAGWPQPFVNGQGWTLPPRGAKAYGFYSSAVDKVPA